MYLKLYIIRNRSKNQQIKTQKKNGRKIKQQNKTKPNNALEN